MAANPKKFNQGINLQKNQLLQAALENLSSAPGSPATGQVYWNTTDTTAYIWDGAAWQDLLGGGGGPETRGLYYGGVLTAAQEMQNDHLYVVNHTSVVLLDLPTAPATNTRVKIVNIGTGGFNVKQTLAGQQIHFPTVSTVAGTSGSVILVSRYSSLSLVYAGNNMWVVDNFNGEFKTGAAGTNRSNHNRLYIQNKTLLSSASGGVLTINDIPGKPYWMEVWANCDEGSSSAQHSYGNGSPNQNYCTWSDPNNSQIPAPDFAACFKIVDVNSRGWQGRCTAFRDGEADIFLSKLSSFGHNSFLKLIFHLE